MAGIIGHVLPLAVGVALSSVPIVVMVLILLSPHGRWSSLTYLIGAVVGLAGLTTLFTFCASLLPPPPPSEDSPLFATIEIVLGLALLALAAIRWRRSRHREKPTSTPKWMSTVSTLGPVSALGLGFVLMLRPKNLLLTIAAGVAIAADVVSVADVVVGIVVFTVLGISTLAAPIIFAVANPTRMRRPLEGVREWMEHNSSTVTTIVVLVLGTVVMGSGIAHI
jgi:hypothetical protein